MFAYKDLEDTIKGHYCCDIANSSGGNLMDCENCPYKGMDDVVTGCCDRLNNDVQYYLKKAKETEQQPSLPGIFEKKEPNNERRNSERTSYERKRNNR